MWKGFPLCQSQKSHKITDSGEKRWVGSNVVKLFLIEVLVPFTTMQQLIVERNHMYVSIVGKPSVLVMLKYMKELTL
jgi:hypothetical protein